MVNYYYSNIRDKGIKQIPESRKGCWVHVVDPSDEEINQIVSEFNLEKDLIKDALDIYEAPRVEKENGSVYLFTRYCFPEGADIATEPLLLIYTNEVLITVLRRNSGILDGMFSPKRTIVTSQRTKTLLEILVEVNRSYEKYMQKVVRLILSIRSQLSKTDIRNEDFIEFIDLEENLNEFMSALQPQSAMLRSLIGRKYFPLFDEDKDLIEDLSLGTSELIEIIMTRLKTISNTREAYATIMANTLNKTFKKLTSISIFMTIPMITTGLYGMNLALPLQRNPFAYWYILFFVMAMTAICVWLFKKLRWL